MSYIIEIQDISDKILITEIQYITLNYLSSLENNKIPMRYISTKKFVFLMEIL